MVTRFILWKENRLIYSTNLKESDNFEMTTDAADVVFSDVAVTLRILA